MSDGVVNRLVLVLLACSLSCNGSSQRGGENESPAPRSHADKEAEHKPSCPDNGKCAQRFCDQVHIPGGVFEIGSDTEPKGVPPRYIGGLDHFGDEKPEHKVQLDAFCIDKYEVTAERYAACVNAGACDPSGCMWPDDPVPADGNSPVVNHYPPECKDSADRCPHHPVNCKTFEQASNYCAWTGRRLCTEAEWERAANGPPGPQKRKHPWGDAPVSGVLANVPPCGPGYLERVDRYSEGRSVEGIVNLIGNVYEWVAGYYAPYDPCDGGVARNPTDNQNRRYRIGRGGGFFFESNYTITERTVFDPNFDWGCVGIRCCDSVE